MADESALVPAGTEYWQVILHDTTSQQMVLYNPQRRSVCVQHGSDMVSKEEEFDLEECPFCRRVMPRRRGDTKHAFVAANYFSLLESSVSSNLDSHAINTGYYKRFFKEVRRIGSGGFGSVFLCQHILDGVDLGSYAVKKVPVGNDRPWLEKVLREVRALECLHHRNVISYKHSWLENYKSADFGPEVPCLFILMEYANGGSLASFLWPEQGTKPLCLSENEIWRFFVNICMGLRHLHHRGIIHRDLKAENLLLHSSFDGLLDRDVSRVMLSDFGSVVPLMNIGREERLRTGCTGTVEYMAPELLRQDEHGCYSNDYDHRSDVWSLGVILYSLCYSSLPFSIQASDVDGCVDAILSHHTIAFPSSPVRSSHLQQLISSLLDPIPSNRPTTDEIIGMDAVMDVIRQMEEDEMVIAGESVSRSPVAGCVAGPPVHSVHSVGDLVLMDGAKRVRVSEERTSKATSLPSSPTKRLMSPNALPHHGPWARLTLLPPDKHTNILPTRFVQILLLVTLTVKIHLLLRSCTVAALPVSSHWILPPVLASWVAVNLVSSRTSPVVPLLLLLFSVMWPLVMAPCNGGIPTIFVAVVEMLALGLPWLPRLPLFMSEWRWMANSWKSYALLRRIGCTRLKRE